jgi:hypothetical protein
MQSLDDYLRGGSNAPTWQYVSKTAKSAKDALVTLQSSMDAVASDLAVFDGVIAQSDLRFLISEQKKFFNTLAALDAPKDESRSEAESLSTHLHTLYDRVTELEKNMDNRTNTSISHS